MYEGECRHHGGSRFAGSCSPVCVDSASGDDQPVGAAFEREDIVQAASRVSAFEQVVLGSAFLGTRVLLLQ